MENKVVNIDGNGIILKFNEREFIAEGKSCLINVSEILYLPSTIYCVQIYMTH